MKCFCGLNYIPLPGQKRCFFCEEELRRTVRGDNIHERRLASQRNYRLSHSEQISAYNQKYYLSHRGQILAAARRKP